MSFLPKDILKNQVKILVEWMYIFGNAHVTGYTYALCGSKCTKGIKKPFKKVHHKYKVRKIVLKYFLLLLINFTILKKNIFNKKQAE